MIVPLIPSKFCNYISYDFIKAIKLQNVYIKNYFRDWNLVLDEKDKKKKEEAQNYRIQQIEKS
jgi:hypothetical protein